MAAAQAKSVALTFDDGLDPDKEPRAAEWNAAILGTLARHGIRSMVFPSLRHTGGQAGRALVADWSKAGHLVGNHTSQHRNLGSPKLTAAEFIGHVQEADAAFAHLPGWRPLLRFPYLKEGETTAKRDEVRAWMKANGYRPAPVSIDASDWYYDEVFRKGADRARLKAAYVRHLLDRAAYYDGLAREVLGHEPPHVLLLHTSALNAAFLGDVIRAFREAGWTIVAPLVAFADPLYAREPRILPAGEGIVWAVAKEQGVAGLRYPAEDSRYEKPILEAAGLLPANPP
ncbi:MAG: polysaccharide deacetylase family protein [Betaproteobacteria bacterium]|nr:polysaccharide deacetylase family protein [Betaproteobacteria bacterium]